MTTEKTTSISEKLQSTKKFLIISTLSFVGGYVFYLIGSYLGFVDLSLNNQAVHPKTNLSAALLLCIIGGALVFNLVVGWFYFNKLLKKVPNILKVLIFILFFVVFFLVAIFTSVFYYFYNLVMFVKWSRTSKMEVV